jgi:hypothetical protein
MSIPIICKGSIGKDHDLGLSEIKRHIAKPLIHVLGLLYEALIQYLIIGFESVLLLQLGRYGQVIYRFGLID